MLDELPSSVEASGMGAAEGSRFRIAAPDRETDAMTNVPTFGRRSLLAGAAFIMTAALAGPAFADGKVIRISTPGAETEIQSKALAVFKDELEKALPGAFDVQLHYNGTLFAQGTEIEAMQRGNLEVG